MEEKNKKYSWNLKEYYNSLEDYDKDFERVQVYLNAFDGFKGNLNNKEVVLKYFKTNTKISEELEKLGMFISLSEDLDFNDNEIKKRSDLLDLFYNKLDLVLTPLSTELSKQSTEFFDDCMSDPRFANYKMKLDKIKANRIHYLSEKEENIFALMGSFNSGFEEIYTNIMNNDMRYRPIMVNGKEEKVTSHNLITFYKNEDREVRKQAYLSNADAISKRVNSAVTAYIYKLKLDCMDLKLRKHTSMLDAVLESEKIPKEVYYKLIEKVEANRDFSDRFYEIKKRSLGYDKYYAYDSYLPLSPKANKKLTIEEQIEIMRKALQPLGEEYCKNIDKAINENWFDLEPSDSKLDRTFATMSYALRKPYVFMQQNYDLDSLEALVHEFGHAVNFEYIIKNQPKPTSGVSIYCAEIASVTNELLLADYLYKNTNDLDEKIYYLENLISGFMGTLITQAKFSQFEDYAYKLVENGEPITVDKLCDEWYKINKKYNGKFDEIEEMEQYKKGQGFISIHHFVYYAYYVFNYATSYTCASVIASKILSGDQEMKKKYLEFLSKGSSQYPDEQVKEMGIDLSTGEAYDLVFKDMNEKLAELDALVELRDMRKTVKKKLVPSSRVKSQNSLINNKKEELQK